MGQFKRKDVRSADDYEHGYDRGFIDRQQGARFRAARGSSRDFLKGYRHGWQAAHGSVGWDSMGQVA